MCARSPILVTVIKLFSFKMTHSFSFILPFFFFPVLSLLSPLFLFFSHRNQLFFIVSIYNTVLRISILVGVLSHYPLGLALEGN